MQSSLWCCILDWQSLWSLGSLRQQTEVTAPAHTWSAYTIRSSWQQCPFIGQHHRSSYRLQQRVSLTLVLVYQGKDNDCSTLAGNTPTTGSWIWHLQARGYKLCLSWPKSPGCTIGEFLGVNCPNAYACLDLQEVLLVASYTVLCVSVFYFVCLRRCGHLNLLCWVSGWWRIFLCYMSEAFMLVFRHPLFFVFVLICR